MFGWANAERVGLGRVAGRAGGARRGGWGRGGACRGAGAAVAVPESPVPGRERTANGAGAAWPDRAGGRDEVRAGAGA